ncbi:hypothetical protein Hte_009262 [Hypoxylon texense]
METREDASSSKQSRHDNRQYTTVGSVWQPQSQPMQPPERRGRTLKSLQTFEDNFLSLTDNNSSNVPSFYNPSSSNQYSSEYYSHQHPNQQAHQQHQVHHMPQYSPLQQNFDRAVSPYQLPSPQTPHHTQTEDPDQQINTLEEYYYTKFANMSGQQQKRAVPVIPVTPLRPVGAKKDDSTNRGGVKIRDSAANAESSDDEDEHVDEDAYNRLMRLPIGTLVNLTTYKNPMQKPAQRVLENARRTLPAAGGQTGNQAQPQPQVPIYRPTPRVGIANIRSDYENTAFDLPYRPFGPSPAMPAPRNSSPYPAILARGPGAPQPLTAGPPGQRQFRPAGFESPWQSAGNPRDANPLENVSPHYQPSSAQAQQQRAMYAASQQSNPSRKPEGLPANRWGATTIPWGMNMGRPSDEKMSDTLTEAEARRFYPRGLPADFNYNTEPIPDDWQARRMREVEEEANKPKNPMVLQRTPGWQAEHKAKLDSDFYGGNDMINKSMNMAVHEQNSRNTMRAIGSEMKESKKAQGKVVNRQLSVEQADNIPVNRHAEPILSMVYQTLAERPGQPKTDVKGKGKAEGPQ